MENTNLFEEETKLRKEAEEDFYWGNLHLARFLISASLLLVR